MKRQPASFATPPRPAGRGGGGVVVPPPIAGATNIQLHLGALPVELADLLKGFGSKAAWQADKLGGEVVDKEKKTELEEKNMVDEIKEDRGGGPPAPGADAAAIRLFNQQYVAVIQPGTNKAALHQFMDDLRQALHKSDDQMPAFWRYEAKSVHDIAMLKQATVHIETKFESAWKGFVPNYAFDIEKAYQCIQHNCKPNGLPASHLTLLDLMSRPQVRIYFLQLVTVFVFDADVAASKRAPTIDDKLKMNQLRDDMIGWFRAFS